MVSRFRPVGRLDTHGIFVNRAEPRRSSRFADRLSEREFGHPLQIGIAYNIVIYIVIHCVPARIRHVCRSQNVNTSL